MTTALLSAEADAGHRGKQFVAAITGRAKANRDAPFALAFLGRRESGTTEVQATPGVYLVRDVRTSTKVRNSGAAMIQDRCVVVWMDGTAAVSTEIEESRALDLAQQLDRRITPDWSTIGRDAAIARHEWRIEASSGKPDDMPANVSARIGDLPPGPSTYGAVRAARRAEIARLRGESPALPVEIDALPSDPRHRHAALAAERAKLVERVAQIDAELVALGREEPHRDASPAGDHLALTI